MALNYLKNLPLGSREFLLQNYREQIWSSGVFILQYSTYEMLWRKQKILTFVCVLHWH